MMYLKIHLHHIKERGAETLSRLHTTVYLFCFQHVFNPLPFILQLSSHGSKLVQDISTWTFIQKLIFPWPLNTLDITFLCSAFCLDRTPPPQYSKRQTDRQTDRQTERETERQRERQRNRDRVTERACKTGILVLFQQQGPNVQLLLKRNETGPQYFCCCCCCFRLVS